MLQHKMLHEALLFMCLALITQSYFIMHSVTIGFDSLVHQDATNYSLI